MILKWLGMSVRNADGTSEHLPPPRHLFPENHHRGHLPVVLTVIGGRMITNLRYADDIIL